VLKLVLFQDYETMFVRCISRSAYQIMHQKPF